MLRKKNKKNYLLQRVKALSTLARGLFGKLLVGGLCLSILFYFWSNLFLSPSVSTDPQKTEPPSPQRLHQVNLQSITVDEILNDKDQRVSDEFNVPPTLLPRVKFWFDIYSNFTAEQKIIHHKDFPWIIVSIIDGTAEMAKNRARWYNQTQFDKSVEKEIRFYQHNARTLAGMKNLSVVLDKLNCNTSSVTSKVFSSERPLHRQMDGAEKAQSLILCEVKQLWQNQITNNPLTSAQQNEIQHLRFIKSQLNHFSKNLRIQTGQRNFFKSGLEISNRYFPLMEKIFNQENLPLELTRLPLVESSFNKQATSKVGAKGIWQIMPQVGNEFLHINPSIDERLSPLKATRMAAELFKENYRLLNKSWPLAVTAYNHGPGPLRKAIRTKGYTSLEDFILYHRHRNFSFASENFYCEFLAALYTEKYKDYLFPDLNPLPSLQVELVKLPKQLSPEKLAQAIGVESKSILDLNPDLLKLAKNKGLIPKYFQVFLPINSRERLETYFKNIPKKTRPNKIALSSSEVN